METRSSKRKKISPEGSGDQISDLPNDVLHRILSLLPIKSIAQTSVLSKRWRSIWLSIPDVDFTTIASPPSARRKRFRPPPVDSDGEFIAGVLELREKQCERIRLLRFRGQLSFRTLNGVMRLALKRSVEELDMEVTTEDYFNLPRSIVRSDSLRVLRVKSSYPGFRLPPSSLMSSGFTTLTSLSLSLLISYNQPSLTDLFTQSSFPALQNLKMDTCFGLKCLRIACMGIEVLTLENCYQLKMLEICCPKLEKLRVASCFDAYKGECWVDLKAPKLSVMEWENNAITEKCKVEKLSNLKEGLMGFFLQEEEVAKKKIGGVSSMICALSLAHSLTLQSQCIEILSRSNYQKGMGLPEVFTNLRQLEVHTGFNMNNVTALALLFKCSPSLHTLVIKILKDFKIDTRQGDRDTWEVPMTMGERYWESRKPTLKPFLQSLKIVKIKGFSACENEINLVKFLLKHGKSLEDLILCCARSKSRDSLRREKVRSQMKGFTWASSNVKIAFQ